MAERIIGRVTEKALLSELLVSDEPELLALYGRRRVGKTFLIRNTYEKHIIFECTGIHQASMQKQLENFLISLREAGYAHTITGRVNWIQVFQILIDCIKPKIVRKKQVLFFDEFPWFNTHRSGFLQAFDHFWNTWASRQNNLVVVICGSAASWMIRNVVNNRGGLHNRITSRIRLMPFSLSEVESFLRMRNVRLDRYQVLQVYMVMGGIPQYLKEIRSGESSTQAIDRTCFTKDGFLRDEFRNLYYSLFEEGSIHIEIVRALARKSSGLTRNEIIGSCGLSSGGRTTLLLDELAESGFITGAIPFNKTSKDAVFRLTDEYSHFYLRFMEHTKVQGPGSWIRYSREASWKSWSGYAFEGICIKHIRQLKRELGIEGVYSEASTWRSSAKDKAGAQIDLLIDRQDRCINICEIKFSIGEFVISNSYATELEKKLEVFRARTQTNKALFLTMITTFGVKDSENKTRVVQNEIRMDALFEQ